MEERPYKHKYTRIIIASVTNHAVSISRLRRMEQSYQQARNEQSNEYDAEYHASVIEALEILLPDQATREAYCNQILQHQYTLDDLQAMARVHRDLDEPLDDPYYLGLLDAIKSLQADDKSS